MDLIAKLPVVAATIYRNTYRDGKGVGAIDSSKDWSQNFCEMLGYDNSEFTELMRLYLTIHRYAEIFIYCISQTIRHTMIFLLHILEKNNDECILLLVIYWKKTGLVNTKLSNCNIIYSA